MRHIRKEKPVMIAKLIRVEEEVLQKIRIIAAKHSMSSNEFIRAILRAVKDN